MVSRRLESTLYMQSNMMADSKQDLLQMAISPKNLLNPSILEFKKLQGHLLILIKALYGTRSGGARWHDRLFDILQELKFKPSKADPDVWMRPEPGGTCYEYIAVYVDDLAIAAKDPQAFCHELKKKVQSQAQRC